MALQVKLPQTRVRLSGSIRIFALPDVENSSNLIGQKPTLFAQLAQGIILASEIQNNSTGPYGIGEVRQFSKSHKRENIRRYSLGRNAFTPFQIVPGKIETTVIIEKAILYSEKQNTLNKVFMFFPENLLFQQFPFIIMEWKNNPTNDLRQQSVIFYLDCWFSTSPVQYNIDEADQWVINNYALDVGSMLVFDFTSSGIQNIAGTVLGEVAKIGIPGIGTKIKI